MKQLHALLASTAALVATGAAQAHTGHGAEHAAHSLVDSVSSGLAHPLLGPDHLLAMLAVGLWSAAALPAGRRVMGPLAFVAALMLGAALGAQGLVMPLLEPAIALSVVLMGALLLARQTLPGAAGLALVAAAGVLHGLAHGAEAPLGGGFAAYALGFMASSMALHAAGLGLGARLLKLQPWVWRTLATLMGASGLLMLAR
jgi:urease accessory protein